MKNIGISGRMIDICLQEARKSPCQKRGFGAAMMLYGSLIGVDHNRPIPGLERICDPECVRLKIPSGTDSMIGSCGHAEEWLIWEALKERIDIRGAEIYVAGVDSNGDPLVNTDPSFYCIRCATAMARADLRGVWVWAQNTWHFLTVAQAIESSLRFALGKEKA